MGTARSAALRDLGVRVFDTGNAAILAAAEQPWLLALASLDGPPALPLLALVAALGAITGDNVAFAVGRLLRPGRFSGLRLRRMAVVGVLLSLVIGGVVDLVIRRRLRRAAAAQ